MSKCGINVVPLKGTVVELLWLWGRLCADKVPFISPRAVHAHTRAHTDTHKPV